VTSSVFVYSFYLETDRNPRRRNGRTRLSGSFQSWLTL